MMVTMYTVSRVTRLPGSQRFIADLSTTSLPSLPTCTGCSFLGSDYRTCCLAISRSGGYYLLVARLAGSLDTETWPWLPDVDSASFIDPCSSVRILHTFLGACLYYHDVMYQTKSAGDDQLIVYETMFHKLPKSVNPPYNHPSTEQRAPSPSLTIHQLCI